MIKRALLTTILLNSVILIGIPAGHGFGIMIMFEIMSIPALIKTGINYQKDYPFESSLLIIALVSLVGKLISIVLLFSKDFSNKNIWMYIGLALMLIPLITVCFGAWNYEKYLFFLTMGSAIPFLMYLGRVIYLSNKQPNKS